MNLIDRYFRARARLDYMRQRGGHEFLIDACQKTLNDWQYELPSWLTQEVLDKMWTGRRQAQYIGELIGELIVWPVDRCYGCVHWDGSEETDGCKVYGEQLVVCDRFEKRIEV